MRNNAFWWSLLSKLIFHNFLPLCNCEVKIQPSSNAHDPYPVTAPNVTHIHPQWHHAILQNEFAKVPNAHFYSTSITLNHERQASKPDCTLNSLAYPFYTISSSRPDSVLVKWRLILFQLGMQLGFWSNLNPQWPHIACELVKAIRW